MVDGAHVRRKHVASLNKARELTVITIENPTDSNISGYRISVDAATLLNKRAVAPTIAQLKVLGLDKTQVPGFQWTTTFKYWLYV